MTTLLALEGFWDVGNLGGKTESAVLEGCTMSYPYTWVIVCLILLGIGDLGGSGSEQGCRGLWIPKLPSTFFSLTLKKALCD